MPTWLTVVLAARERSWPSPGWSSTPAAWRCTTTKPTSARFWPWALLPLSAQVIGAWLIALALATALGHPPVGSERAARLLHDLHRLRGVPDRRGHLALAAAQRHDLWLWGYLAVLVAMVVTGGYGWWAAGRPPPAGHDPGRLAVPRPAAGTGARAGTPGADRLAGDAAVRDGPRGEHRPRARAQPDRRGPGRGRRATPSGPSRTGTCTRSATTAPALTSQESSVAALAAATSRRPRTRPGRPAPPDRPRRAPPGPPRWPPGAGRPPRRRPGRRPRRPWRAPRTARRPHRRRPALPAARHGTVPSAAPGLPQPRRPSADTVDVPGQRAQRGRPSPRP